MKKTSKILLIVTSLLGLSILSGCASHKICYETLFNGITYQSNRIHKAIFSSQSIGQCYAGVRLANPDEALARARISCEKTGAKDCRLVAFENEIFETASSYLNPPQHLIDRSIVAENKIYSGEIKLDSLNYCSDVLFGNQPYKNFPANKAMFSSEQKTSCYAMRGAKSGDYALAKARSACEKDGATDCRLAAFQDEIFESDYEYITPPQSLVDRSIVMAKKIQAGETLSNQESISNGNPPSEAINTIAETREENLPAAIQSASARFALVIGNGNYQYAASLKNPINDANDIAKLLQRLGFNVDILLNVSQAQMDKAISALGKKLTAKGSVGLFFYAGHGTQMSGENYLLPVDANPQSEAEVKYKAVNVGQLLKEMDDARNGMNIVMLDACRDNPFPRAFTRSLERGLARVDAPKGTIIAFATSPGHTASDGSGRNGLYTQHLLKNLETLGLPIEIMFKKVLQGVNAASNGNQTPWISSSFTGDFFFNPAKQPE